MDTAEDCQTSFVQVHTSYTQHIEHSLDDIQHTDGCNRSFPLAIGWSLSQDSFFNLPLDCRINGHSGCFSRTAEVAGCKIGFFDGLLSCSDFTYTHTCTPGPLLSGMLPASFLRTDIVLRDFSDGTKSVDNQ